MYKYPSMKHDHAYRLSFQSVQKFTLDFETYKEFKLFYEYIKYKSCRKAIHDIKREIDDLILVQICSEIRIEALKNDRMISNISIPKINIHLKKIFDLRDHLSRIIFYLHILDILSLSNVSKEWFIRVHSIKYPPVAIEYGYVPKLCELKQLKWFHDNIDFIDKPYTMWVLFDMYLENK